MLLACFLVPLAFQNSLSQKSLIAELDQSLSNFSSKSLIPGIAVAIVNNNGTVYSKGLGMADRSAKRRFTPQVITPVASVSKILIASAVMKLVEQGKLQLDEPVNSVLPFKVVNPKFPNVDITIRHLLTHTSSITDSFETYSVGEADVVLDNPNDATVVPNYLLPNVNWHRMSSKISLFDAIKKFATQGGKWFGVQTFSDSAPGTRFQYSNIGASIAALAVEIRSGISFEAFTKKYIFAPLKMKNTGWNYREFPGSKVTNNYVFDAESNPTGVAEYPRYFTVTFPSTGLKTTVSDLSKFAAEMIRGAEGKGMLLSGKSYKSLLEPQLNKRQFPMLDCNNLEANNSLIWSITKDGNYEHLGGNIGVYAFIRFSPKTRTASIGVCNLRDDSFGEVKSLLGAYQEKIGISKQK